MSKTKKLEDDVTESLDDVSVAEEQEIPEKENVSEETSWPDQSAEENVGQPYMPPRQIVGIGFVPSIKGVLADEEADENSAIEKIADKCIHDFVLKCVTILEECAEIPSTAYTYVTFMERFAWLQQEDSTTKAGTRNILVKNKPEVMASKILDLYQLKNEYVLRENSRNLDISDYFHEDLLYANGKPSRDRAISALTKMFGKDLFPEINVLYNYNDREDSWQYVYSIVAPKKN